MAKLWCTFLFIEQQQQQERNIITKQRQSTINIESINIALADKKKFLKHENAAVEIRIYRITVVIKIIIVVLFHIQSGSDKPLKLLAFQYDFGFND